MIWGSGLRIRVREGRDHRPCMSVWIDGKSGMLSGRSRWVDGLEMRGGGKGGVGGDVYV